MTPLAAAVIPIMRLLVAVATRSGTPIARCISGTFTMPPPIPSKADATPAPVAPTRTLVVSGLYHFVRNPMYVAVAAMIFGQAILFASWGVALYGVVIAAAFHTFVRLYEEPTLRRAYDEEYVAYCAATPRWVPRFRR